MCVRAFVCVCGRVSACVCVCVSPNASGTMGNLISVAAHCQRGEEVVLGSESHIYNYEQGGVSGELAGCCCAFLTTPSLVSTCVSAVLGGVTFPPVAWPFLGRFAHVDATV